KARVPKNEVDQHGQYQLLGKLVHQQIAKSKLVELPAVGHIPHIQNLDAYKRAVSDFLTQ
nr:alpha/beta hydrolase [Chitinophagales bacterium]